MTAVSFSPIQTGRVVIWDGARILSALSRRDEPRLLLRRAGAALGRVPPAVRAERPLLRRLHEHAPATRWSRATASRGIRTRRPGERVTLLTIEQPFDNHNGGQLQFGPDGYLYIGMGDGGSANDPICNAQRDDSLLGKLLRIDVDQNRASALSTPSRPTTLPARGVPIEVWAKGLRNPWRFSFDRRRATCASATSGRTPAEEVDVQPAGDRGAEHYGWKVMEGTICGAAGVAGCPSRLRRALRLATAYMRPVVRVRPRLGQLLDHRRLRVSRLRDAVVSRDVFLRRLLHGEALREPARC